MSDPVLNQFEIERRVILFKSSTTMPDGTQLGYNDDPNNAVSGETPGQTLIYTCPVGTRYQEDDGKQWIKKTLPNIWNVLGSDSGSGSSFSTEFVKDDWILEEDNDLKYLIVEHKLNTLNPNVNIWEDNNYIYLHKQEIVDENNIKLWLTTNDEFDGKIKIDKIN